MSGNRGGKLLVPSDTSEVARPATVEVAFYSFLSSAGLTLIQAVASVRHLTDLGIEVMTGVMLLAFPALLASAVPALFAWLVRRGTRAAPLLSIFWLGVATYFVLTSDFEWLTILQLVLAVVAVVATLTPPARGFARAAVLRRSSDAKQKLSHPLLK